MLLVSYTPFIQTTNVLLFIVVVLLLCIPAKDVHYRITSRKRNVGGNDS